MPLGDEGKPSGRQPARGRVQTRMGAWWVFLILVGCGLSHAVQSQSTCACIGELYRKNLDNLLKVIGARINVTYLCAYVVTVRRLSSCCGF